MSDLKQWASNQDTAPMTSVDAVCPKSEYNIGGA